MLDNLYSLLSIAILFLITVKSIDLSSSNSLSQLFETYGTNGSLNSTGFQLLLDDLRKQSETIKDEETSLCLNATSILESNQFDLSKSISSVDLSNFCPSILHQLILPECHHNHENERHKSYNDKLHDAATWGYTIAACFVISLVGLMAVAIIPIMHKVIYNHALQFLVALAIGSLTGDALLHLLPHAIRPHDAHKHGMEDVLEKRSIFLGLTALVGIFLFFVVERLVGFCSEFKRHQNEDKQKINASVASSSPMVTNAAAGLRKQQKHQQEMAASCESTFMMVHANKDVRKFADNVQDEVHRHCETGKGDGEWVKASHGHHHHSHDANGSIASVAWMVIVGDGFHNFADGIAIGSAFSSGFQDGLSTSIAVFCHELPHELGDFAMLLSAGMSPKQALVYNCISSLLCFCGAFVGIVIGNFAAATPWIFALVAGLFLYIALVDMLPEMRAVTPRRNEHPCLHLSLQLAGMLLGASIMLLIALFEDNLATVAGD